MLRGLVARTVFNIQSLDLKVGGALQETLYVKTYFGKLKEWGD